MRTSVNQQTFSISNYAYGKDAMFQRDGVDVTIIVIDLEDDAQVAKIPALLKD